jgi:hypothetical protein
MGSILPYWDLLSCEREEGLHPRYLIYERERELEKINKYY